MTGDRDVELVRDMLRPFDALADRDRFARYFDPRHSEIVPLRAALEDVVYAGPDAPYRFLAAAAEEWESLTVQAEQVRRMGDRVLALARLRARSRGAGLELDTPMGLVIRLRDGKIVHVHTFSDPADAVREAEGGG